MGATTQQMIQDGLWRDIAEAPKDGTTVIVRYPPKLRTDVEYIERLSWFDGWLWRDLRATSLTPTHFRPLPDDRLANAMKVAVEALEFVYSNASQSGAEHGKGAMCGRVKKALAEIERIAGGE